MKIAVVQKCPSNVNYEKHLGIPNLSVFNMSSEKVTRLLKKDVDLVGFNPAEWDWVILVGSEAVKNWSKVTSVTDYTGKVLPGKNGEENLIACISPAMLAFKPENKPVFDATVQSIHKVINGNGLKNLDLDIELITDNDRAVEHLKFILNMTQGPIGLDSETSSLAPRDGYILGLSISYKELEGRYILSEALDEYACGLLQKIIETRPVVLHNAKFDMKFFTYHLGLDFSKALCVHDTMIQHYLLDERQGTHGLKSLTMKYGRLGDYDRDLEEFKDYYCKSHGIKKDDFSYDLIPIEIIWKYACLTHNSKVLMADGTTKTIGALCRSKSTEKVLSYNETTKKIEAKSIIGWHKNDHRSKEWFKLRLRLGSKELQSDPNGIPKGPAFTRDHKIYTQRGYVQVQDLVPTKDSILTTEKKYTEDTYQVIFGSLMGDGSLQSRNGAGAGVLMSQAEQREGYIRFKALALNCENKVRVVAGSGNRSNAYTFQSEYNHQLTDMFHELEVIKDTSVYRPRPTSEFLSKLDKRALAIWYFDDGNLPSRGSKPRIWSRTFVRSNEYSKCVLEWLRSLGYVAHVHNDETNNQFFVIDNHEEFFKDMIKYLPSESVKYKIPEKYWDNGVVKYNWRVGLSDEFYCARITEVVSWSPPESNRGFATKWCIDVEDNHNFFTLAGLVHNCLDTSATLELHNKFLPIIEKNPRLKSCYYDLMLPALHFLTRVEERGIPVSKERLLKAKELLLKQLDIDKRELYQFEEVLKLEKDQGSVFNPNSVQQLRKLLFDYLNLPVPNKLTATGAISTDADVLLELSSLHRVPELILSIKKNTKLINTYVDKLIPAIDMDGRVRTGFNLTSTTSGRLSSSGKFNFQQLPARDYLIKGCLKAPKGYRYVAYDMGTAEVWIAAALSGDKEMQKIFQQIAEDPDRYPDFHSTVAHAVYSLPCEPHEVKKLYPALRQAAKAISFSLLYGSGPANVAETINLALMETGQEPTCTVEDAKGYFKDYYARFPKLKKWIDSCHSEIKENGYIYSFFGRKRRLHNINSADRGVAAGEVRSGFNAIIQSSSSDVLLLGAIDADIEITESGLDAEIIGLVHDSIVGIVREDQVAQYGEIIVRNVQKNRGLMIPGAPMGMDEDTEPGGSEDYSGGKLAKDYPEVAAI